MNILPEETACLACLFPRPPGGTVETCDTAGILNTAVNFAASVEVTEAMKFLVGARAQMRRTLLGRDLWSNDQAEISAATPRAGCAVCQQRDFAHLRGEARPQITLCGRNSVQIHEHHRPVDFAEMERRLRPHVPRVVTRGRDHIDHSAGGEDHRRPAAHIHHIHDGGDLVPVGDDRTSHRRIFPVDGRHRGRPDDR